MPSLYHPKAASWQDITRDYIPTSLGPGQDNGRSGVPKTMLRELGFFLYITLQSVRFNKKTRRSSKHSLQTQLPVMPGTPAVAIQGYPRQPPSLSAVGQSINTVHIPPTKLCKTVTTIFYNSWDVLIKNKNKSGIWGREG